MKPLASDDGRYFRWVYTPRLTKIEEGTFSLTAESEVKYSYFTENLICLIQRSGALEKPLSLNICGKYL